MKRVLLDTNIYGEMLFDGDLELIKNRINSSFVIHGFQVVRKELKEAPKKFADKRLRLDLLALYDVLTRNKQFLLSTDVTDLAEKYFKSYREFGGSKTQSKLYNDFLIVACATLHEVDVVASEDTKTMLVENAVKAYHLVNKLEKRRTPQFIGYIEFKRWLV